MISEKRRGRAAKRRGDIRINKREDKKRAESKRRARKRI